MSDDLDALVDQLADRVLARVAEKMAAPPVEDDPIPEGGLIEAAPDPVPLHLVETEPEPARPSFPRPPRTAPTPMPVRGVEETLRIGDALPISQPEPYYGSMVGGGSTRPPESTLANWFDQNEMVRRTTVPVEMLPKVK